MSDWLREQASQKQASDRMARDAAKGRAALRRYMIYNLQPGQAMTVDGLTVQKLFPGHNPTDFETGCGMRKGADQEQEIQIFMGDLPFPVRWWRSYSVAILPSLEIRRIDHEREEAGNV